MPEHDHLSAIRAREQETPQGTKKSTGDLIKKKAGTDTP
jgi:hypothetical protein